MELHYNWPANVSPLGTFMLYKVAAENPVSANNAVLLPYKVSENAPSPGHH